LKNRAKKYSGKGGFLQHRRMGFEVNDRFQLQLLYEVVLRTCARCFLNFLSVTEEYNIYFKVLLRGLEKCL
jgi:hypothetical protein